MSDISEQLPLGIALIVCCDGAQRCSDSLPNSLYFVPDPPLGEETKAAKEQAPPGANPFATVGQPAAAEGKWDAEATDEGELCSSAILPISAARANPALSVPQDLLGTNPDLEVWGLCFALAGGVWSLPSGCLRSVGEVPDPGVMGVQVLDLGSFLVSIEDHRSLLGGIQLLSFTVGRPWQSGLPTPSKRAM